MTRIGVSGARRAGPRLPLRSSAATMAIATTTAATVQPSEIAGVLVASHPGARLLHRASRAPPWLATLTPAISRGWTAAAGVAPIPLADAPHPRRSRDPTT